MIANLDELALHNLKMNNNADVEVCFRPISDADVRRDVRFNAELTLD
jgi:hypothetical protein